MNKRHKYKGPNTFPNTRNADGGKPESKNQTHWWFKKYECRCEQTPITCTPTDYRRTIEECDNLDSSTETKCGYKKVPLHIIPYF